MQISLPQVLPEEPDFNDPHVLFKEFKGGDDAFAKFIEKETVVLRHIFVSRGDDEDEDEEFRDAYEQFFDSSANLVKNSLELDWDLDFELGDIRNEVLRLEESKKEFGLKFTGLQRVANELSASWWRMLSPMMLITFLKVDGMIHDLGKLRDEFNDFLHRYEFKRWVFGKEIFKNCSKTEHLLGSLLEDEDLDFAGELQILLHLRQREFLQKKYRRELKEYNTLVEDRLVPIRDFINGWCGWRSELLNKYDKFLRGVLRVELLVLLNLLVGLVGLKMWKGLSFI